MYSYSRQIEDSHRRPIGQHPPRREFGHGKVWPGQKNLGEGILVVVVVLIRCDDDKIVGRLMVELDRGWQIRCEGVLGYRLQVVLL